jgi:hypothetical protein
MNSRNRKEINKMMKNINHSIDKENIQKCEDFCKKDFIEYTDRKFRNMMKKYKLSMKTNSKQEKDKQYLKFIQCKKTFCNPKCIGRPTFFGNKQKQMNYAKTLKNGFIPYYNTNKVNTLKKKGALSGCLNIPDYDVFHK